MRQNLLCIRCQQFVNVLAAALAKPNATPAALAVWVKRRTYLARPPNFSFYLMLNLRLATLCSLLITLGVGFGESLSMLHAQPAPPPVAPPAARKTDITLEDLWMSGRLYADRVPGFNFSRSGGRYTQIIEGRVEEVDFATGKTLGIVLDYGRIRNDNPLLAMPEGFDGYTFSDDQQRILLSTNEQPIYRHSSQADAYVFDRKSGAIVKLDTLGQQLQATLSPDGRKVAYVRDNDLYFRDLEANRTVRVTIDGRRNAILNGITDWVYEEEFGIPHAFVWSPDSKSILFIRFDEQKVPEFTMEIHTDTTYPEYRTWKYPKVGEANSTVTAHVYDLASAKTRQIFDSGDGDTHVPRYYWTNDNKPMLWVTNRHQNEMSLQVEPRPGTKLETVLAEKRDTYLDVHDDLRFLQDGTFLWTSDKSGYNHIYHHAANGKLIAQLTKGNYPVTEFYGIDEVRGDIYFQAAAKSPLRREVYRVPLTGGKPATISTAPGWNEAVFAADYSGYMLTHSTANTPPTYTIYDRSGKLIRTLVDGAKTQQVQREESWRPIEYWTFKTPEGVELNGWRITPEGFSESASLKYPLFMFQYSGPGSQQVVDRWGGHNHWWFQMLAQQGYIVACVDPRGTGGRGADFQKQTYLELGELETQDQIAAAKYLGEQSWIDADRIGIFGWSYGGYMSSLCITKGADVFKLAIAVAPVTNWKWYDSIYTERYMRTTRENPSGYHDNSPIYFADKLKGHYLLVHGSGDDNVHAQHSIEMANALIAANKDFEFDLYPNRNHGIYGGVTRYHLYKRMTEFINRNL